MPWGGNKSAEENKGSFGLTSVGSTENTILGQNANMFRPGPHRLVAPIGSSGSLAQSADAF